MARRFYSREDFEETSDLVKEKDLPEEEIVDVLTDDRTDEEVSDELVGEALEGYLMAFEEYQEVRNRLLQRIGYNDNLSLEKENFGDVGGNLLDRIGDKISELVGMAVDKAFKTIRNAKRRVSSTSKELQNARDLISNLPSNIEVPKTLTVGGSLNTGKSKAKISDIIAGLTEVRDMGLWLNNVYSKHLIEYTKELITELRSNKWYKGYGPATALIKLHNKFQDVVIPAHPKAKKISTSDIGKGGKIFIYQYGPIMGDIRLNQNVSDGKLLPEEENENLMKEMGDSFDKQTIFFTREKTLEELESQLSDSSVSKKDLDKIISLCNEINDINQELTDDKQIEKLSELNSKLMGSLNTFNVGLLAGAIVGPLLSLFGNKARRAAHGFSAKLVFDWGAIPYSQYSIISSGVIDDAIKLVQRLSK